MGDPLLGSGIRARRIPGRWQIAGECHQCHTVHLWTKRRGVVMPGDAILNMRDPLQGCVPAGLEFACHQTLGWVDDLVTAGGQGGLVACFLELPTERLPDLVVGLRRLIGGLDRGSNGVLGDRLDDLRGNGAINSNAANTDA